MNRYVKLFVIICVFVNCTGCSFTKEHIDVLTTNDSCESNDSSWISNEINPETAVQEEYDSAVGFETHSNDIDLLDPPFDNRTLENPNKEWDESDIFTAWNLTDASKVYTEYTDRLFCDIDNDLSFELILTSYSTKKMYFFKKINNEVGMLYEFTDIDVTNGNILIPPTDKENIEKKEVYDFQDCNLFKLYNNDGNVYVSGISWRPAVGKTCWIKKLIMSKDDIAFVDVFRWGMFTKNDRIASEFEYRRYDFNGNYSHTTQQEINDFLLFLDDIPYDNSVIANAAWETLPQLKQAISNVLDSEKTAYDIEQKAAELMDRNMICAYLYHTQVLFRYEQPSDENGYYPAEFLLFRNFEEYKSFIRATYIKETADSLLYGFEEKAPIFIEKNGEVFYNPNNMGFTVGPYFYTGYIIKNFSEEETVCNFTYAPLLNDGFTEKEYSELCQSWGETFEHTCRMVLEDGEWKLSELTGAF